VARPTRQARRERREQARADGAAPERARPRQQQAVAAVTEPAGPEAAPRRRGGVFNFIVECWGELKKVEWPSQRQVMTGTVVVIIACTIVGTYLWGVDLALKPFVERLLLGQK
jgi:preprotein translocase subunit SecE